MEIGTLILNNAFKEIQIKGVAWHHVEVQEGSEGEQDNFKGYKQGVNRWFVICHHEGDTGN